MSRSDTPSTSLWAVVEAMQTRLEGAGMEDAAVDVEVVKGVRSLFWRRAFSGLRSGARKLSPLALDPGRA